MESYDIVVVGAGTGGAFAAATAASAGFDVAVLERKPESEAGHIACGDAIKGKSAFPDVIDRDRLKEEAFTNRNVSKGRLESDRGDLEVELPSSGCVLDRRRYGEVIVEEAQRAGAAVHFDTVVQSVRQDDAGVVRGVRAVRDGDPVEYAAAVTVDAAGALSVLQDTGEFDDATLDSNVNYQQFCSAYREVIEVPEPVDWHDTIVFKPTAELGYLWYFPRSPTEINVGLGFQMNKDPMELVEVLREDVADRPEFAGATVTDKLGAALPTRRPYDSATAPGYLAVGDAAGLVNPTTGGGIVAAAKSGYYAAQTAMDAIDDGTPGDEDALWAYNSRVMGDFGKRFAALDLYNIWGGAHDMGDVVDVVTAIPAQQVLDTLSTGDASMGLLAKARTLANAVGNWGLLYEAHQLRQAAGDLKALYGRYPDAPDDLAAWQADRDALLDDVYDLVGADPKY
jgi:electron-transferring-flavoprotein dehydrogenase